MGAGAAGFDHRGMFRRPGGIAGEHVGVDVEDTPAARRRHRHVVGRAEAGIARQHHDGLRDVVDQTADPGLAHQGFAEFRAVGDVDELVILDARQAGEQGVLRVEIFGLAIQRDHDGAPRLAR